MLVYELELGVLWDEYGLIGDAVVNLFLVFFFSFSFLLPALVIAISTTNHGDMHSSPDEHLIFADEELKDEADHSISTFLT